MYGENRGAIKKIGSFIFHYTVIICITIILPLLINHFIWPVLKEYVKCSLILPLISQYYFIIAPIRMFLILYIIVPVCIFYSICYISAGIYIEKKFKENSLFHSFLLCSCLYIIFLFLPCFLFASSTHYISIKCYILILFTYKPFLYFVPLTILSVIFYKKFCHPLTIKLITHLVLIIWFLLCTEFIYFIFRFLISKIPEVIILIVPVFICLLLIAIYRIFLLKIKRKEVDIMELIPVIIINLIVITILSFLSHKSEAITEHAILYAGRDNEKVIKNLDRALSIEFINHKNILFILSLKGEALTGEGKYEEAIKCYNKVLNFNSSFDIALIGKGDIFARQGEYDEAMKYYDKALDFNPYCHAAWAGKGEVLASINKYKEAAKSYKNALDLFSMCKPGAYYDGHSISVFAQHDYCFCCAYYRKFNSFSWPERTAYHIIAYSNFRHTETFIKYGNILISLKNYEEAINCYYEVSQLATDYMEDKKHREDLPKLHLKIID